jgi:tartrate dehydratase alpha subunit/fumarate hydratase class I-like protein
MKIYWLCGGEGIRRVTGRDNGKLAEIMADVHVTHKTDEVQHPKEVVAVTVHVETAADIYRSYMIHAVMKGAGSDLLTWLVVHCLSK